MKTLVGSFRGMQYELNMSPPDEDVFICPECGGELEINNDRAAHWLEMRCPDCGFYEKTDTFEAD